MAIEDLHLFQSSSNGTKNYFTICIDHPPTLLIWSAFSILCFLLGFPATILVLRELFQRSRQKTSNDFFVFNMTVIDFGFLTILPINIMNYIVWYNTEFECICNFMYTLTVSGRPLFMACVCGEYYFAVVHPIMYRTSKRAAMIRKAIAVIIWMFISGFGIFIVIYTWALTTTIAALPLLIALPIICFCDVCVYRALRKKDPSGRSEVHPQKKRALRTIISSFVMTFTAYLPPAVIFALGHDIPMNFDEYYCTFIFLAFSFGILGSVIMPFLYLESLGQLDIQKMFKKM